MPERRFLTWTEPLLTQAAQVIVDRYSSADRVDATSATIVVPGARAGRRLLELLIDEAERHDSFLSPPAIVTAGALPELLYQPRVPLARPALLRLTWVRALQETSEATLAAVFPYARERLDLSGLHGMARILNRLSGELGSAGLTFGDAARRVARLSHLFDDSGRWSALAEIESEYGRLLGEVGMTDRESARRNAIASDALGRQGEIWLLGIAELPPVVAEMVSAEALNVTAFVHAPPELESGFDELGCVFAPVWRDMEVPIPDGVLAVADRPADQADVLVRFLASLEERPSADEVTVGVLDGTLIPYLEQALATHGVHGRLAEGTPIGRTGPFRLLQGVSEYLDGRSWASVAALLRHPDAGGWIDADRAPDTADRYFERHLPACLVDSLPEGKSSAALARLVSRLKKRSGIGRLAGQKRLAEWMPDLLTFLTSAYEASEHLSAEDERRVVESCLLIRDHAVEIAGLPDPVNPICSARDALRILLAESAGDSVPPAADRRAVELVGWLETHLDDAPVLALLGVNEPFLPGATGDDPFLPNSLRSALGLLDDERRYARDAYRLLATLHSRRDIKLIVGRRDSSGDPMRPSRLLFAADAATAARRVLDFATTDAGTRAEPPTSTPILPASVSGFHLPPEPEIEVGEIPDPFPVTQFRALLSDPYRWALERVLGLREAGDSSRELDGGQLGSIAHDVLHAFGTSSASASSDEDEITAVLDSLLDAEAAKRFAGGHPATVSIQLTHLKWRLRKFARWQASWASDGWRIVATEAQPPADGVPFVVDGRAYMLTGRVDRIDHNASSGEWAILDYKSGENAISPDAAHRTSNGWIDLQLPLYRYILPAMKGIEWARYGGLPREEQIRLGYVLLPADLDSVGEELVDWDEAEMSEALAVARDVLRTLRDSARIPVSDATRASGPWDPFAGLLGQRLLVTTDHELEGDLE
jgi:hypothetical protein